MDNEKRRASVKVHEDHISIDTGSQEVIITKEDMIAIYNFIFSSENDDEITDAVY